MTRELHRVHCVVDDRVFLLGLDELYRTAMRRHEAGELLVCARKVCEILDVVPATGPVEGYYAEEPALTEYFQRMRALQNVYASERARVASLQAFQRLEAVTSSPLYGKAGGGNSLLPAGKDPLSAALEITSVEEWQLSTLVAKAREIARGGDDLSLVGLGAFAGDPVVLTALRETAVLYAMPVASGISAPVEYTYEWRVDPGLAERAQRFVSTFNALFQEHLPAVAADQAAQFWKSSLRSNAMWRCVRIACDIRTRPARNYHWAICADVDGRERVHEFWHDDVWTTERLRQHLMERKPLP